MENNRLKAIEILGIIEDYLHEKGVTIENTERENEYSAILYGTEYYDLEDKIEQVISRKDS